MGCYRKTKKNCLTGAIQIVARWISHSATLHSDRREESENDHLNCTPNITFFL